jgi:hypothetical protein
VQARIWTVHDVDPSERVDASKGAIRSGFNDRLSPIDCRSRESSMDVAGLADLLHETSLRHGSFEASAPPHNWWDWYAAYIDGRQAGAGPDDAAAAADCYMAEVKHIAVPA